MANYFDPEAEDAANPTTPEDTQSSDASKPGLRKAWDAWTSKPENNAALLQFGIAMLQPRGPGQSGIGSVANAVGEGAGAMERNVTSQQATDKEASQRAMEEAKTAATTSNAESTRINANAYRTQAEAAAAGGGKGALSGMLRQQADFRKWLAKPEDISGLSVDPVLGAIQKTFPEVKSKGDLLANPRALSAAQKLFSATMTTEPSDDGTLPDSAPAGAPTPPTSSAPQVKTFYDSKGAPKQFQLQGGQWIPMQQ